MGNNMNKTWVTKDKDVFLTPLSPPEYCLELLDNEIVLCVCPAKRIFVKKAVKDNEWAAYYYEYVSEYVVFISPEKYKNATDAKKDIVKLALQKLSTDLNKRQKELRQLKVLIK